MYGFQKVADERKSCALINNVRCRQTYRWLQITFASDPTIGDLKATQPALGQSLQQLLDWTDDMGSVEEIFCYTFQITQRLVCASQARKLNSWLVFALSIVREGIFCL